MEKHEIYKQEHERLIEIFGNIEEDKKKFVNGLIDDAAFLYAENAVLKAGMAETGMIRVHPNYPDRQKPTEAAKQYLKNVNSYAVVMKTLNGILNKAGNEEDDELGDYQ
jgi:hypothetical protein